MITMFSVQVENERRTDLLREAQRERLLGRPESRELLASLGRILVRLGQAMQTRAVAHSHTPIHADQKRRFELA